MVEKQETGTYTRASLFKQLVEFEQKFGMTAKDFFEKYENGEVPPTDDAFVFFGLCSYLLWADENPHAKDSNS